MNKNIFNKYNVLFRVDAQIYIKYSVFLKCTQVLKWKWLNLELMNKGKKPP